MTEVRRTCNKMLRNFEETANQPYLNFIIIPPYKIEAKNQRKEIKKEKFCRKYKR